MIYYLFCLYCSVFFWSIGGQIYHEDPALFSSISSTNSPATTTSATAYVNGSKAAAAAASINNPNYTNISQSVLESKIIDEDYKKLNSFGDTILYNYTTTIIYKTQQLSNNFNDNESEESFDDDSKNKSQITIKSSNKQTNYRKFNNQQRKSFPNRNNNNFNNKLIFAPENHQQQQQAPPPPPHNRNDKLCNSAEKYLLPHEKIVKIKGVNNDDRDDDEDVVDDDNNNKDDDDNDDVDDIVDDEGNVDLNYLTSTIRFDVIHDLFDTQHGLLSGLAYTVQITAKVPDILQNFYVESFVDGQPKGTFIDSNQMSNIPKKFNQTEDIFNVDINRLEKDTLSDGSLPWVSYPNISALQPSATSDYDNNIWVNKSGIEWNKDVMKNIDGYNDVYYNNHNNRNKCLQNIWNEYLVTSEIRQMNWILNEPNLKNKTVKFRFLFRKVTNSAVFEIIYMQQLLEDCNLSLKLSSSSLDFTTMPLYRNYDNCIVFFPSRDIESSEPAGLLVQLTRLNVPCNNGGYISIGDTHFLCGKFEDLSLNERTYYFSSHKNTSVTLHNHPMFSLNYKLVDYCYNITLTEQNSSVFLQPKTTLECYFKIHLPYGNRIELNLITNLRNASDIYINKNNNFESSSSSSSSSSQLYSSFVEPEFLDLNVPQQSDTIKTKHCNGILVQLDDTKENNWRYCVNVNSASKKFNVISSDNTLVIRISKSFFTPSSFLSSTNKFNFVKTEAAASNTYATANPLDMLPSIYFEYVALPITQLVSQCAFGWVAAQPFCITAIELPLSWSYAEIECKKRGGHLASVRSEREQRVIDNLLLHSSGYKDNSAYWVGASDKSFEGDYRWSNGFPFAYSNWFPGWSEHSNYNKQPNDDGLSGQDCVELRRFFRVPPGIHSENNVPLSTTYMWNDRDCNAKNFFLCERTMSDEPLENADWVTGCNKTIFLTKDHPRASIWSPGFPRQYPDNINCFTVVIAPTGYNIVIEFEELVLETEPECSYDYLEIIDAKEEPIVNHISIKDLYQKYLHRRRGRSLLSRKHFLYNNFNDVYSAVAQQQQNLTSNSTYNRNSYSHNLGEDFFENFLNIYKAHTTVVLKTPKFNTNSDKFLAAKSVPHRVCGDWSSKLKLLRYVTSGALLGLHFRSDYSHHFSGYKAKVTIKNASSECADERLIPYNGTCYLFVSYPEVDWQTAQQVCRGIGAQLASIASSDEQRFIVGNIRNQLDYSPQAIYWLGGELAQNKEFEWSDGSKMSFKGWLPGQDIVDNFPIEPICLGLQWKMSPTPMLPSGLYWASQKCKKYGGYICKKRKQKDGEIYIQNKTISGTEGRLTSPGYPNTYPLNIDYWIKIIGPERTRLIVQFQVIDLEHQEECLYDYVSVQDETIVADATDKFDVGSNAMRNGMIAGSDDWDYSNDANVLQDYKKIKEPKNGRHTNNESNIQKRNATYLRDFKNFLKVEDDLRANIVQLEHLRSKLETDLSRKKRFLQIPNHQMPFAKRTDGPSFLPYVRWCGSHNANMSRFDFVSSKNRALLHFRSDYSLSGIGFSFLWTAVDISGCPKKILTSNEGVFTSPNYPHFLLNNLDCSFIIQATLGRRIFLEFTDFESGADSLVEIDIGSGFFTPFKNVQHLNDGIFVSLNERLVVRMRTGQLPKGKGFRATYKSLNIINEERTLNLSNLSYGSLLHLNYPKNVPSNLNFTEHLIAPLGNVILLEINGVGFSENRCRNGGSIEIYDNYADTNGTFWHLCALPNAIVQQSSYSSDEQQSESYFQSSPIHVTSYLNTLHVQQLSILGSSINLNATIRIQPDINYKYKLATADNNVESCLPNPCLFDGKCIQSGNSVRRCECKGHYTGRFCALNMCEMEPCLFGKCELTDVGFKCHCQQGYIGRTCDQRQKPCASNPCEGRGECFDKLGSFFCRCHAWWEGQRCEKRMVRIPYKPLSERMLQEPFWLGLITVFVVMAFIGLVWCAKRHFPEKIEKLLAEEAERNRPPGMLQGHHHHHQSLREQLQFTSSTAQSTATTTGAPRTILGRLGIRKPSILSLSSPQPPGGATARTFSLDDLLRPPPRRTPSPRKKRNNSTPTKKNAAEKKQILQQLITPAANPTRTKISLDDLIHMSEKRLKTTAVGNAINVESDNEMVRETTFSENLTVASSSSTNRGAPNKGPALCDAKLEKKVTFARLLNKVSAEMSSGSEVELDNSTQHDNALNLPVEIPRRASSVPPSPSTNDMRSPHSTSSNQGSDSLSSSDLMLPDIDIRGNKRLRSKVSSADSILAMFRNFASTNVSSQIPTASVLSPSSSPSASSPQDDVAGDDESSTSSMHTPVSFTSGPSDSPVFYRQSTIEVPVLDILNAQKQQPNQSSHFNPPTILLEIPTNMNKCLSPIREMPTPMPSPALTPVMSRPQRFTRFHKSKQNISTSFSDDDEKISIEHFGHGREIRVTMPPDEDTQYGKYGETGMPNKNTQISRLQVQQQSSVQISIDVDPPTPEERSSNRPTELIIPQLCIEQPSPIKERLPILYPGSPPPQRQSVGETNFFAPNKQKSKLKQSDKSGSLDLPLIPPMITITANMSEAESDADILSPRPGSGHLLVVPNSGMCYLSPFSICTRGDRTISESNLSSSGYSSMASPGPSRCGSSNPLCPNEMEDPGSGSGGSQMNSTLSIRGHGALVKRQKAATGGIVDNESTGEHRQRSRSRSDSETLSDDVLLESNDEGIGTDHLDEKIEDGEIKSAKELEMYIGKEFIDVGNNILLEEPSTVTMAQLQLPLIVIQTEGNDKGLSPVSSRSESPLSERTTSMGRFSPLFYGRKDQQLPFTDSDGLYDFPSSDGKGYNSTNHHCRKSSTKRRDRKSSRSSITQSPTKSSTQLEIPAKESSHSLRVSSHHHHHHHHSPSKHHHSHHHSPISTARKSPKRRPIQRYPVASSSSSSESIAGPKGYVNHSSKEILTLQLRENQDSKEDTASNENITKSLNGDKPLRTSRKIGRLRAIGNQIRFLRRLEKSIKNRDSQPNPSPSDSCHDDNGSDCGGDGGGGADSPTVTSPLLLRSPIKSSITTQFKIGGVGRQKRLANLYGTNIPWRSRERESIHGDINSD